jgi:extradiol dioxygenase family protein
VLNPFIRFEGQYLEQETFFIKDPHCNILEIKSYSDSEVTYPTQEPVGHPEWGCP